MASPPCSGHVAAVKDAIQGAQKTNDPNMPETFSLTAAIYTKTAAGQQEIQSRSLGLSPLVRRILVLVDGKRSGADLAVFLSGQGAVETVLNQLLELGCVEAQTRARPSAPAPEPAATADLPVLSEFAEGQATTEQIPGLPPADTRSANDNEMARNFMINSVNSIIGQNTRISLVNEIFNAKGTEGLRKAFHHWESSMSNHGMGAKRLPELREKLFKVL